MRRLLRRVLSVRAFLVYGALLGVAVMLAVQYRVTPWPLRLESKRAAYAIADVQLVGDLPRSPIATSGAYPQEPLNRRVTLFAAFIGTSPVQDDLLERLGLPPEAGAIDVVGSTLVRRSGRRDPGPSSVERLEALPPGAVALATTLRSNVPVLTVYARAPSTRGARRLAESASAALRSYVLSLPVEDVRSESLVTLSQLGPAESRTASVGPDPRASGALGLVAGLVLVLVRLALGGLRRRDQAPAARYASSTRRAVSDHG